MRANAREDRRRRLLGDDRAATQSTESPHSPTSDGAVPERRAPVGYTELARAECQPRIGDLIPTRPWTLSVMLLAGLTCVVGLEWLYVRHTAWSWWLGSDRYLAALDLDRPGNLGAWFSSLTLALTAVVSLWVYGFRRHKVDDYRGRYRVWLWCSAGAVLASIDATAGIHKIVQGAVQRLPGLPAWGDGAVWWMLLTVLTAGILGMDAIFDLRHCRTALTAFATALACYLLAALVNLGVVLSDLGAASVMIHSTAAMTAHLLLLTTTATYLRHVFLDAQGLLPAASERSAEDDDAKNDRVEETRKPRFRKSRRSAPATEKPVAKPVAKPARPLAARIAAKKRAAPLQQATSSNERLTEASPEPTAIARNERDPASSEQPAKRKMTKTERKRLRKLRRQQANRAA